MASRRLVLGMAIAAAALLGSLRAVAGGWPVACTPEAGRSYLRYDAARREVELGGFRPAPRGARSGRRRAAPAPSTTGP